MLGCIRGALELGVAYTVVDGRHRELMFLLRGFGEICAWEGAGLPCFLGIRKGGESCPVKEEFSSVYFSVKGE